MKKILLSTAFLATSWMGIYAAPYTLDVANSAVKFNVHKFGFMNVEGHFKEFSGTIDYADGKLNVLEGVVLVQSINTDNTDRDTHLNASDSFDSAKYPNLHFKMTKFENDKIYGDLTIKTITKPIMLDAKINIDRNGLIIDAVGVVNRVDFGIVWEGAFLNTIVSDEAKIIVNLKAIQQ